MRKINQIIIHCSDSYTGNAVIIDEWHKKRGWDGIGYHYVIGNGYMYQFTDGSVEAGRHVSKEGAHAYGHNKHSIGICLIGQPNPLYCEFTIEQLRAAKRLCRGLMSVFGLMLTDIVGHYEVDNKKTCPAMDMDLFRMYLSDTHTADLVELLKSLYR